ncbi:hypothetical protein [Anaeromyxobacter oryzisoli]|uniref:hypothetical protein n=1 Tax=Anaeromyxobacter oryzisoli TaxID=2925408 RepID=UPI001F589C67|nr:hypothetical protein [Anaeromyxobacter sp. SG63]
MNRRLLAGLALVLAGGAGCGGGGGTPGLGLSSPAAVALFQGVTTKNAGLHPYVAVANAGKDELVLVDAVDDQPVLAPVIVRPLSIPVSEPRPAHLVAASLGDGKADLLVVVSAGSTVLQLVKTWDADTRVVSEVDLSAAAGGAEVLAVIAAPVPVAPAQAGGAWTAASGRVRIVAALSGGRLAVVEYQRAADGSAIEPVGAPDVHVQDLSVGTDRFDAVDLAVNPKDPRFVYAASTDPIPVASTTGGATTFVLGVAALDATAAPGAWTWTALSARAPTTAVAAWRLQERLPDSVADDTTAFQATPTTPVDRVYAALDPAACGAQFPIDCGVAVLDPATGQLAADPAGLMPYLPPIHVPGIPLRVTITPPPAVAPSDAPQDVAPYMRILPATGARTTTGVAAILSSDGHVYFADLGRWTVPNDASMLRTSSSTRAAVTAASTVPVTGARQELGLWDPDAPGVLARSGTALLRSVWITPGFTPSDTWSVVYQGLLPGLSDRRAQVGSNGGGQPWLAIQTPGPAGALTQVARLYGPELGVHAGDIVQLDTRGVAGCPANEALVEARVAAFLAPDAATRPGGAVALGKLGDLAHPEWDDCVDALGVSGVVSGLPVSIRASGYVLVGTATGYAGRPTLVQTPSVSAVRSPNAAGYDGFQLRYQGEDGLSCPLVPWPANPSSVACDDACRATCEQLVLARKARRFYFVTEACAGFTDCIGTWPAADFDFPKANGPVVAFKLGLQNPTSIPTPPRDTSLTFTTRSGLSPAARGPTSSAFAQILPTAATTFDRSPFKTNDGYRFYVTYSSGFVLDFSPSLAANQTVTIQ